MSVFIYYGDEILTQGYRDPFNRKCFDWTRATENNDMLNWYKKLIQIRKNNECLTNGIFKYLEINDEKDLIVMRAYNDTEERYIIIHNGDDIVTVNSLAGKTNLLTDTIFDGTVSPYEAIIL